VIKGDDVERDNVPSNPSTRYNRVDARPSKLVNADT
jgi:hypothetical protein